MRDFRKKLARVHKVAIQFFGSVAEEVADGVLSLPLQHARPHESINEIAIAHLGGHAPRADMRLRQITSLLQRPHLLAHGRRRSLNPEFAKPRSDAGRPHRLGRAHIVLHHHPQHRLPTLRQILPPSIGRGQSPSNHIHRIAFNPAAKPTQTPLAAPPPAQSTSSVSSPTSASPTASACASHRRRKAWP